VDVSACASCEAFKEICHQLGLQVADKARADFGIDGEGGAATEVDGRDCQCLVHGHKEVAGAQDAALVAEGAVKDFTERYADIFDGVVLIYVEVAVAFEFEIEGAMAREEFKHVIEEANAGGDFVLTGAFDRQLDGDVRLGSVAFKSRSAWCF
jgi:hypothetical protein